MALLRSLRTPSEWLSRLGTVLLLCVVVMSALDTDYPTNATIDAKSDSQEKRDKRSTQQRRLPTQLQDILNQINRGNGSPTGNLDLLQFTPTTPRPEDVNCYIDIKVVHRIGGRCVPLGTRMGCQAGIHLAPSQECVRTSSVVTAQQTNSQQSQVLAWIRNGRGRHRSRRQPSRGRSRPTQ